MSFAGSVRFLIALGFLMLLVPCDVSAISSDWLPVTSEELALTENSAVPSLHAVILYYEHDEDDRKKLLVEYYRIKVFSEAGKRYANVETRPCIEKLCEIEWVKARRIRPDGSTADFKGPVFDKVIGKRRGFKMNVKTFTIPDVHVGTIFEYKVAIHWKRLRNPEFKVQHDLPMLKGHYRLRPASGWWKVAWASFNVNPRFQPVELKNRDIVMEIERVPHFNKEEFAPPETELRARVQFFYGFSVTPNTWNFWAEDNKAWSAEVESFMDKRSEMTQEVASIFSRADPDEMKLRKIYDRVQQLRNRTYESRRTSQEEKREFRKNKDVKDVLRNGYGSHDELNRLFTALARAAGFTASIIRVAERDSYYFHREIMSSNQFSAEIAVVDMMGKTLYLAPGVLYCPFAMLPWEDTSASGFKVGQTYGQETTPAPSAEDTVTTRTATARLSASGDLEGTVEISFTGQKALQLRLDARDEDEGGRNKMITDLVHDWLPSGSSISVKSVSNWTTHSLPLKAIVEVSIPGFAVRTGKRLLVPITLFARGTRNPFLKPERLHPIHFEYTYIEHDELTLTLPDNASVDSLPIASRAFFVHGKYSATVDQQGSVLKSAREFQLNSLFVPVKEYKGLRRLFESTKLADEAQAVLKIAQAVSHR